MAVVVVKVITVINAMVAVSQKNAVNQDNGMSNNKVEKEWKRRKIVKYT